MTDKAPVGSMRAYLSSEPCNACVSLMFVLIIVSAIAAAALDHVFLMRDGYTISAFNGSTIRSFRELTRSAEYWDNDSWGLMNDALAVLNSPERDRLYEKLFFEDKSKFQYAPTSLVYVAGLGTVSLASDGWLNAINAVIFILTCAGFPWLLLILMRQKTPGRAQLHEPAGGTTLALSFAVALLFYPLVRALELGQIQVWINALFLFACIAWLRDAIAMAGVFLAIAATIKPQYGVFLIWALLWREWIFLRGFLGAGLVVGVISLALFGLHNHLKYLEVLSFISRHGETFFANQSINGLVNRALQNGSNLMFEGYAFAPFEARVAAATFISSIAILAIALVPPVVSRNRRRADIIDLAIVTICTTIASPIAWEHHYGVMLPVLAIALVKLCATGQHKVALVTLAVSWILAANYFPIFNHSSATWFNVIQSYLFFAALMLLGVLLFLRSREIPQRLVPAPA